MHHRLRVGLLALAAFWLAAPVVVHHTFTGTSGPVQVFSYNAENNDCTPGAAACEAGELKDTNTLYVNTSVTGTPEDYTAAPLTGSKSLLLDGNTDGASTEAHFNNKWDSAATTTITVDMQFRINTGGLGSGQMQPYNLKNGSSPVAAGCGTTLMGGTLRIKCEGSSNPDGPQINLSLNKTYCSRTTINPATSVWTVNVSNSSCSDTSLIDSDEGTSTCTCSIGWTTANGNLLSGSNNKDIIFDEFKVFIGTF